MKSETLLLLAPFAQTITHVGSRITCSPAPTNTDDDILVLLQFAPATHHHKFIDPCCAALKQAGWEMGGSLPDNDVQCLVKPENRFYSWTKGEENLILTGDYEFHTRFLAATRLAKKMNLLDKADRVELFQAVIYGVAPALVCLTQMLIGPYTTPPAASDLDDLI